MAPDPALQTATDVCKSFGQSEVLNGLPFDAARGGVIATIGSSGAGKSTFLRCPDLLDRLTGGRISLHGHELVCRRDSADDPVVPDCAILVRG